MVEVTLRRVKGLPLTFDEGDDNFEALANAINPILDADPVATANRVTELEGQVIVVEQTANEALVNSNQALVVGANAQSTANDALSLAESNNVRLNRLLNPSGTDPIIRDDGFALQEGDQYYNTVIANYRYFDGNVWIDGGGKQVLDIVGYIPGPFPAGFSYNHATFFVPKNVYVPINLPGSYFRLNQKQVGDPTEITFCFDSPEPDVFCSLLGFASIADGNIAESFGGNMILPAGTYVNVNVFSPSGECAGLTFSLRLEIE